MSATIIILDPTDPDLFHTDPTCDGLHSLLVRAELATGAPVDEVGALVDQAEADGLLVVDGVAAGLRCCRGCREHAAHQRLALALAA